MKTTRTLLLTALLLVPLTAPQLLVAETQPWLSKEERKPRAQAKALGLPAIVTNDGYDKHELEQCDVGISECDALIAQTGTVLVTSQTAGGRCRVCHRITW